MVKKVAPYGITDVVMRGVCFGLVFFSYEPKKPKREKEAKKGQVPYPIPDLKGGTVWN